MNDPILIASAHGVNQHFSLLILESEDNRLEVYMKDVIRAPSSEYCVLGKIKLQDNESYIFGLAKLINAYAELNIGQPFKHPNQFILDIHTSLEFDIFEEELLRIAWVDNAVSNFYLSLDSAVLRDIFDGYQSLYHPEVYRLAERVCDNEEIIILLKKDTNCQSNWQTVRSKVYSLLKPLGRVVHDINEWRELTGQSDSSYLTIGIGGRFSEDV